MAAGDPHVVRFNIQSREIELVFSKVAVQVPAHEGPIEKNYRMIKQLLLALVLTSVTVGLHAVGTVYGVLPLSGIWSRTSESRQTGAAVIPLTRLVSALLVLHLSEMSAWAAVFAWVGMLPDFETALYFSLKSYTTVGYGDVLPPLSWRLVGPIEAAVGVLMLGWSTAMIVAAVQRIYGTRSDPPTAA